VAKRDEYLTEIGPEQAWFLGLVAADGNISDDGQFTIAQSGDDGLRLIQYLAGKLNFTGKIYAKETGHKTSYVMSFRSKPLCADLASYGILPRKSLTLEFSSAIPKAYHTEFLRGYIDGDGFVGICFSGKVHYLCVSFVGTEKFTELAHSITPIVGSRRHLRQTDNCWEVRWYGKKALAIGQWLWSNPVLFRGKEKAYREFLSDHSTVFMRYAPKLDQAKLLISQGNSVMKSADMMGMPFQTLYKWRAKGLL